MRGSGPALPDPAATQIPTQRHAGPDPRAALEVYRRDVVLNDQIGARLEEELDLPPVSDLEPPIRALLTAELEDEPTDEQPRLQPPPAPEDPEPAPPLDPVVALLTEIRDLLKGPDGASAAELEVGFLRAQEAHARQRASDEHELHAARIATHKTVAECIRSWLGDPEVRKVALKALAAGAAGGGAGATATGGVYLGVQAVELGWHLWGADLLRLLGIL